MGVGQRIFGMFVVGAVLAVLIGRTDPALNPPDPVPAQPVAAAPAVDELSFPMQPDPGQTTYVLKGFAPDEEAQLRSALRRWNPEAARLGGLIEDHTFILKEPPGNASRLAGAVNLGPVSSAVIDIETVNADGGQALLDLVVAHELGHLIDQELLDPAARARLDAAIPAGGRCGADPDCDLRAERFADAFAAWALGRRFRSAYGVQVPADLARWGRPLSRLAR